MDILQNSLLISFRLQEDSLDRTHFYRALFKAKKTLRQNLKVFFYKTC
jgi:hypothetical protein